MKTILSAGLWFALIFLPAYGMAAGVADSRRPCFSVAELPKELQPEAEKLFLEILDSEALYTVLDDLKPMSSGARSFKFAVAEPDLKDIERARRVLAAFRCDDRFYADVHVFSAIYEGNRQAEVVVFNLPRLKTAIAAHRGFFEKFGVTPESHPMDVLQIVEHAEAADRWRGYGYLFGYPDSAVDFFVEAGESQKKTGQFVKREFYQIPSFGRATGSFVWAVPVGHTETDEERTIRARAVRTLETYRGLRERFVGPGKPGVARLLASAVNRRNASK